jgi:hypothetical protein
MVHKILFCLLLAAVPFYTQASEVTKADWINSMSTVLPAAFCNADQYFRQCFEVSAQECEETAATATRVCLNKYKNDIPNLLNQPEDGSHWGSIIGSCTGEAYEIALIKQRSSDTKCNDPANWQ